MTTALLLFFAAFLGGALNAVAGGGSFIGLPALLMAGVSPVSANATTTLAMWPGSVASGWAYRRDVATVDREMLVAFGIASLAGGLLGGLLLVRTSDTSFMRLLPWLMLAAAVTFTFGGRATRRAALPGDDADAPRERGRTFWVRAVLLQFCISIYGGYFGGGMGIMMLAGMTVVGLTNIHAMNGLKSALAVAINGVALAEFVAYGAIAWPPGLVMVAGGVVGGYSGASLARRVDGRFIRAFVIFVAWTMTAYFFVR